jgi:hypothetical protein
MVFSLFFKSGEISFLVYHRRSSLSTTTLAVGTRWFLWSEDVGTEVVNLPIFFDFVDGRWRIFVQDSTGTPR